MRDNFGVRNTKAKLNINPSQPDHMNLVRVYKYIFSNSEYGTSANDIIKYLETLKFKDVKYIGKVGDVIFVRGDYSGESVAREYATEDKLYFSAKDYKDREMTVIVSLDNSVVKAHVGNGYHFRGRVFKDGVPTLFMPFNVDRLYAIHQIITNKDFKELISKLGISDAMQEAIIHKFVMKDSMYKGKVRLLEEYKTYISCMLLTVMRIYRRELNYKLMEEYSEGRKSDYAKVFETKKNITKKIQHEMETSPYLKYFTFVELDNDVEIDKYKSTIPYFEQLIKEIRFPLKKNELRFRKLGKLSVSNYKVNGAYFPMFKCIAIDIRNVSSFLHEVAHSIDYEAGGKEPLSLKDDFQNIIEVYTNQFTQLVAVDSENYTPKSINYFTTPTEVFARGFELAYVLKGRYNPLVGDKDKFNQIQYKAFKGLEKELVEYYSKFIK